MGPARGRQDHPGEADGRRALAVDGDVVFAQGALRRAVAYAERHRLGHLVALPRLVAHGPCERGFVAAFATMAYAVFRPWLLRRPGSGAFIGSDSQLVAPVRVGKGAYVGTGTTVTSRAFEPSGATAVIPPKANRKNPAAFDKELYKARSAVECAFNLLKQARRFATRYEKTLRNYSAVVAIGCAMLWLRI